ncbi:MAG TPA: amidohydrolase family protein [Ktedonobacterales bacterium]
MAEQDTASYQAHWDKAFQANAPYAGLLGSGARWDGPVALRGIRLITGDGSDPIERATLVFEGERLTAVGHEHEVNIPHGATTVDANGMTALPGLIDCHVHLNGQWGYDLVSQLQTSPSLGVLYAVPNARTTLEAGFTTVRDAGLAPAGVRQAIERGLFPGPRMLAAITILSQTGGHGDNFMPCCADFTNMAGGKAMTQDVPRGVVDGVDSMRHKVREVLRAGADWIKLCTSGGVLSANDSPESAQFTVEEIAVAVYEAAAQGKRCMAHAQSNRGIKNAIEAGVASIEHGIYLDDEAIQMMIDRNVYLVPTLVAPQDVVDAAEAVPGKLPAYAIEKARAVIEDHRKSFRMAVEAGVRIAMGTDSGVGPHGGNARELAMMAKYGGMSPLQALVSTTQTAAELLRIDHETGTLTAGKYADIVLVDGDPLSDLGLLALPEKVMMVVKRGAAAKDLISTRANR